MNVVNVNYPESYWMFCRGLKENGATVLANVDTPYNQLKDELNNIVMKFMSYIAFKITMRWLELLAISL